MTIDAEFEDIKVTEEELDLTPDESLPWLESDEEEEAAGGIDTVQVMGFFALLLVLAAGLIGGVWYFTNRAASGEVIADGSTIEAPAGPIRERPEEPGGKEFAGTGNVAPAVGEGQVREGKIATADSTGSSNADSAPRPSIDTQTTETASQSTSAEAATSGVAVQLAAYGNRARAERGWRDLSGSTKVLDGVRYRIVKGVVDIGTVYRLQALAPNRAEADKLCSALKADGLECAVKP